MRMSTGTVLRALALAAAWALVGGCAGTHVNRQHPVISTGPEPLTARVYFIRPTTERMLGFADNPITVEADRVPLLKLAKGEYTLLRVKPGTVFITVRSLTSWGPEHDIKEMSSTTAFDFAAAQTYFLVFEPINGEFRGVHFEAKGVELGQALDAARYLRAVGAARSEPISANQAG